jgi:hypothetical protein
MPYLIALVLVAAFTANVVLGAVGQERFVGNVGEMLILFAAAISFSVGILRSEARANSEKADTE